MTKLALLTKQLAAERLGLSVRRLMELSADDEPLRRHRAIDPGTNREAVMFAEADIMALKRELENRPAPASTALVRAVRTAPEPEPIAEFDLDDDGRGSGRLWLTLAEAAGYSGLPVSILRAMIEAGELAAIDCGPRPGGRYRVRRLDLHGLEGELAG